MILILIQESFFIKLFCCHQIFHQPSHLSLSKSFQPSSPFPGSPLNFFLPNPQVQFQIYSFQSHRPPIFHKQISKLSSKSSSFFKVKVKFSKKNLFFSQTQKSYFDISSLFLNIFIIIFFFTKFFISHAFFSSPFCFHVHYFYILFIYFYNIFCKSFFL